MPWKPQGVQETSRCPNHLSWLLLRFPDWILFSNGRLSSVIQLQLQHTLPFCKRGPPPLSDTAEVLSRTSTGHWKGMSNKTAQQCPEPSASQGKSHPPLAPCRRAASWHPQRPLPGLWTSLPSESSWWWLTLSFYVCCLSCVFIYLLFMGSPCEAICTQCTRTALYNSKHSVVTKSFMWPTARERQTFILLS